MNHFSLFNLFFFFLLTIGCKTEPTPLPNPKVHTTYPSKLSDLELKDIPSPIIYKGKFQNGKSWIDENGENILVVAVDGPYPEAHKGEQYAEIRSVQYIKKGDQYELLWDIFDYERHCPFDLWIGLLPNSISITDLDNDGFCETTLLYQLSCRSDVSPSAMKLLMHEQKTKMGLRGMMAMPGNEHIPKNFNPDFSKIKTNDLKDIDKIIFHYGRYENENDFKNQPAEFINFAKKRWLEFITKDDFDQF